MTKRIIIYGGSGGIGSAIARLIRTSDIHSILLGELRKSFSHSQRNYRQAIRLAMSAMRLFFVGSTLAAFLFGVAVGAAVQGLELSELGDYQGTLFDMLSGFSISVGLFTVALLAMHGAIYLYLKTEVELQQRFFTWMKSIHKVDLTLFVIVTLWSVLFVPASLQHFGEYPIFVAGSSAEHNCHYKLSEFKFYGTFPF